MAPKSMASASMLAHVVTSKKGDHLPLYRQEEVGLRGGVWLPRATLSNWCRQAAVRNVSMTSGPLPVEISEPRLVFLGASPQTPGIF